MQNLPVILGTLACPVGMGAMMFFMMRPGSKKQPADPQQDHEIAQLREQVAQLRAEQEQHSPAER